MDMSLFQVTVTPSEKRDLSYRQFLEDDVQVQRHPANGETRRDVDHCFDDVISSIRTVLQHIS